MFIFNMSVKENFASFKNPQSEKIVFVDSFDNYEFNVRFGTIEQSVALGHIFANSDEELNQQLVLLVENLE